MLPPSCMFVFVLVSKRYKVYKKHQSIETSCLFSSYAGSVALVIMSTGSVAPAIMSNRTYHNIPRQADRKLDVTWNGTKLESYSITCLPWHQTRRLTHQPKPLSEDSVKTILPKQPAEEAASDEQGTCPPHHEDDGHSTMYLRGGVLLSSLGPLHAPKANLHNFE